MAVVEAAFVMVVDIGVGDDEKRRLEQAMVAAMERATAEGVTDPDEVRRRILEARGA
jgi:hypothetical protein